MSDLGIFLLLMYAIGVGAAIGFLWGVIRLNEEDIESNELRIIQLEMALYERQESADE